MSTDGELRHMCMALWAKQRSSDPEQRGYHPLLYHLVDVAVVCLAMWDHVLDRAVRQWVSTRLGLSEEVTRPWIAFLAGSHDLGKASVAFALQLEDAHQRIALSGLSGRPEKIKTPHGSVTTVELEPILTQEFALPDQVARLLAEAIGGHHGAFPTKDELDRLMPQAIGQGRWTVVRRELVERLADILQVPREVRVSRLDNATAMWLAGFVSVADWIGSNQDFFPFASADPQSTPACDPEYPRRAADCAGRALRALGWMAQPEAPAQKPFESLFGYKPNPTQQAVMSLSDRLDSRGLVIVEAPMGEGKTEAAFWLADQWASRLGTRGFYVALPTQATSDQMFHRVAQFLGKRYPAETVNVQLLHGHASLSAEFQEMRRAGYRAFRPGQINLDEPRESGPDVVAAEWFTFRKRGLLAPFGVGTVDQVLLAVLQTQHVFVRLFGLANKVVIVDEVHAYDVYMSKLLQRLLTWLAALGSPVVLLSATLPDDRRRSLAQAYAEGLDPERVPVTPSRRYPRVTWLTAAEATTIEIPVEEAKEKEIEVGWVDSALPAEAQDAFPLGEQLREALAQGGVAAVICNTVGKAQATYAALRRYFSGRADDGNPELDLLHARFPYGERAIREKRALIRFGKPGASVTDEERNSRHVRRPRRAVLVATQVIEQSLDLVFDLMVTDLAPIDLVLQRLGRLHRHERRERPARLARPQVWIRGPQSMEDGVPFFDPGSEAVYSPHVLLRSWLALQTCPSIRIPADIERLVESVYSDTTPSDDLPGTLRARWDETLAKQGEIVAEEEREAKKRYIKAPDFYGPLAQLVGGAREEDAPDLHPERQALTRLTELTVPVVLLHGSDGSPCVPDGAKVDLARKPDLVLTRRLLLQSVPISSKRIVYDLAKMEAPKGWQESPLLRHHRAVMLDEGGAAPVGEWTLRLDPDLGVVIER